MAPKKGGKQPQTQKRKRNPCKKDEPDASTFASSSTAMEIDHYKILGVNRNASPEDLRKAYMKLVMDWHPDKHMHEKTRAEAETKFKEINQAYQILSDPEKRQQYVKHQANIAKSKKMEESSFSFPPEDRTKDRFAAMFGFGRRPNPTVTFGPLNCSLEELYQGAEKKMKVTRAVTNALGEETQREEIWPVNIKPGFREGTKMTFKPNDGGADFGVVIKEKRHDVYERDWNDLVVKQEITLLESLTGGRDLDLTTLDGRKLTVPLGDDVIRAPGDEMVVAGEGMPISSQPGVKGNLRFKFSVKFPTRGFTAEQKLDLKKIFDGVSFNLT